MSVHRNYWFGGERPVEGATVYVKPPAPDVPELVAAMTGPVTPVTTTTRSNDMGQPDDNMPLSITLTRKQWREIKAAIGEMWSGPQDALWDQLERLDVQERRHEPDVFGCDFYR